MTPSVKKPDWPKKLKIISDDTVLSFKEVGFAKPTGKIEDHGVYFYSKAKVKKGMELNLTRERISELLRKNIAVAIK